MSEDVVIRADGLGKSYLIGHAAERDRYGSLRDVLAGGARSLWRKTSDMLRGRPLIAGATTEEFQALKDVNFEVKRGEVLGIIGRNGAGKSTLLKILSRIVEPTQGRVEIHGRVSSLLEVGTGFHPELTGRENIYLNGAILGMTRAEIRRKFDEIVDFAGVEKFLDTPVKRYSSGMYVRLAFAVAAHLEPEILIVDEVLAVGDAEFQKKCIGRMSEVAVSGRTVLFVSHNMAAMAGLCSRAIWLNQGTIKAVGSTRDILTQYSNLSAVITSTVLGDRSDRLGNGAARLTSLQIADADGRANISSLSRLKFTLQYDCGQSVKRAWFLIGVHDGMNQGIFFFNSNGIAPLPTAISGKGEITLTTDPIRLTPGRCYVNVAIAEPAVLLDHVIQAAYFDVVDGQDLWERGVAYGREQALCVVDHQWAHRSID